MFSIQYINKTFNFELYNVIYKLKFVKNEKLTHPTLLVQGSWSADVILCTDELLTGLERGNLHS